MANRDTISRRQFLRDSAKTATAAAVAASLSNGTLLGSQRTNLKRSGKLAKKIIVVGIDGMDPVLSERLMAQGQLPNFAALAGAGGYSQLGTSTPPQSPVAWASFINGAGPGSHGIFDFIHRNPEHQYAPFYSAAETVSGKGFWQTGEHRIQLTFWPFNHTLPETVLRRQGVPFWDHLDRAGIMSKFYDLPSNYPPSESKHGNHRCLSGMGTTDMLGTHGTYQHFAEDGPIKTKNEGGGMRSLIMFEDETAEIKIFGPRNDYLAKPQATVTTCKVHRDRAADAALIDLQGQKILLAKGDWSRWVKVDFNMSMPKVMPDKKIGGICRFYLQEVAPTFRLYVTPINVDPSNPASKISEPNDFVKDISGKLGLFYTTGFQEDHKALSNGIFDEQEFVAQSQLVLDERLKLLDYAIESYDDGLLFFYFSSTDMQAHMLWWDGNEKHPSRSAADAAKYHGHIEDVYRRMDGVLGELLKKYSDKATIMVLSDHGFANFGRQFNLNGWLRQNGYLKPADCRSVMLDADWRETTAYGLGINGLYLNLKGRERDGIVAPGEKQEQLLDELTEKLLALRDENGKAVIRNVCRSDRCYAGPHTELAPDLIVGYARGYRASWSTCLGDITDEVLSDNESAWSADHCADASEVPGVLFCNRPIKAENPSLVDLAPTILDQFGLEIPGDMTGRNVFT